MKKLLLTLGAVASVAAPVAAVVACGSTPDATPAFTGKFAENNKAIANIIKVNGSKQLTTVVKKFETKAGIEVYPKMETESDLKRVIEIVDEGYTVNITDDTTGDTPKGRIDFSETYFIKDNSAGTVKALIDTISSDYGLSADQAKDLKGDTPTAITGPKVAYFDATCKGIALLDPTIKINFFNMADDENTLINEEIAKALAPKPAIAPKTGTSLAVTSTLTMAQFKTAEAGDSTPADHTTLEKELKLTLPSSISSNHIYEIDTKDESGKTITLVLKQGTSAAPEITYITVTTA